jgi:hypothetical protein
VREPGEQRLEGKREKRERKSKGRERKKKPKRRDQKEPLKGLERHLRTARMRRLWKRHRANGEVM